MSAGRCSKCADRQCNCVIKAAPGGGTTVAGAGTAASPYLIDSALNLQVMDSPTVDLSMIGEGSAAEARVLQANLKARLEDLLS